jgi:outer membrane protein assembly factor BamD
MLKKIFIVSIILLTTSCKTTNKLELTNAEDTFKEGLMLFNKKNYTEALSFFDMIKLQYPGSNIADKALYYTAEINFIRQEYILASFNYNRVRTNFPGSEYAKISAYKAGLSLFNISPSYHKDQEHTIKAIKTLQEFQYVYPDKEDSLYKKTDSMIIKCRSKLAEKDFRIAELYKKLESPRSALIYYESVLKSYDDTEFYEEAFVGKIEMLYWMKRNDEAINTELTYNVVFPAGRLLKNIEDIKTKYSLGK